MYSSSSLAYTSTYLSNSARMNTLSLLYPFRKVRHGGPSLSPTRILRLALPGPFQVCSNMSWIVAHSNHALHDATASDMVSPLGRSREYIGNVSSQCIDGYSEGALLELADVKLYELRCQALLLAFFMSPIQ